MEMVGLQQNINLPLGVIPGFANLPVTLFLVLRNRSAALFLKVFKVRLDHGSSYALGRVNKLRIVHA